jgi:hypothetical protein
MAEQDGTAVTTWPRLRLDFYDTAVVMSRWTEDGRTTTYPVAVQDVVSACTTVTLGSGLLPPDVLFWRQRGQTVTLGIYVPARRWRVQVEEGAVRQGYHLPLPPLVFVGSGAAYHVFAVRRRPGNGREPLYAAPCPNVHHTGDICRGEARFPVCAAGTISRGVASVSGGQRLQFPPEQRQVSKLPGRCAPVVGSVGWQKAFSAGGVGSDPVKPALLALKAR